MWFKVIDGVYGEGNKELWVGGQLEGWGSSGGEMTTFSNFVSFTMMSAMIDCCEPRDFYNISKLVSDM